jgi:hypothetical protein
MGMEYAFLIFFMALHAKKILAPLRLSRYIRYNPRQLRRKREKSTPLLSRYSAAT